MRGDKTLLSNGINNKVNSFSFVIARGFSLVAIHFFELVLDVDRHGFFKKSLAMTEKKDITKVVKT